MSQLLSCRQSAKLLGVSSSTIKRLCNTGKLRSQRTPGGHRRIFSNSLRKWAIANNVAIRLDGAEPVHASSRLTTKNVLHALEHGSSKSLADRIINGISPECKLATIFDEIVAPALWEIGRVWGNGSLDPYEEHLCSGVLAETLALLRSRYDRPSAYPTTSQNPKLAIGGTHNLELHSLASSMVELTFNEAGWEAQSIGAMVPVESMRAAMRRFRPRVVWTSYTRIDDLEAAVEDNHRLYASLEPGQRLVIGGQALTGNVRRQLKFHFVGDSLTHLSNYLTTISDE